MKGILKIIKYLLITLTAILILIVCVSLIFQGRISQIFSKELSKYVETGIEVEKVRFSLLRGFPKATVEFKNIRIKSPGSEDSWLDTIIAENDFLEADLIYASFNVRDIIRKEYSIDRITLKDCNIFIFSDPLGNTAGRIFKEPNKGDSLRISFDLKNIKLENTRFKYLSSKKHFVLDCKLDNAIGRLSLSDGKTKIQTKSGFDLNTISSADKSILYPITGGKIEGDIIISSDSIYFNQIDLLIDNQSLNVKGSICQQDKKMSLNIQTRDSDLDRLLDHVPLSKAFSSGARIENLNLTLSMNFKTARESFSAIGHSYQLEYAGSNYTGSFAMMNLSSPKLNLNISVDLDLHEIHKKHKIPEIESISGIAHLNARLSGSPGSLRNMDFNNLLKLDRRVNLHLSSVDVKLNKYEHSIQNISGNIMIADNAWGDELSFLISEQNVIINCRIDRIENLFNKHTRTLDITAGIWADKVDLSSILPQDKEEKQERKSNDAITPGQRIFANLSLNIDSLVINKFRSSQFNGTLNYKPGFLNINSFNMLALDGSLSGNAALIRNSEGTFMTKGWFDIETVDINRAFTVFNNFGQDQIIAENLKGGLSGSVSINTRIDSSFKLIPSSLSVTGNYSILDGELINFEPILKLSRFIEVSELESIKFENLHNELLISEQRLIIPSMEINSSAFNISLSGEQDFAGKFEYHLQVLLSDILSKKAKNSGSYVSEFGQVEDDGLGRTTLFLKLEKEDKITNVSYDVEKLSEEIKVSLQEEKQTLKTILNEEYGWYNSDSLTNTTKSNSRKFRISWEEADSVKTIKQPFESSKPGLFKKIFKSDTTKKKF